MRLLLINPNTSVHITERLARSARAALRADDELTAVTGRSGPAVVRDAQTLAEADLNALALAEAHAAGQDAILLGISLDGAARALRARFPDRPVVGMTEAALMTACLRVERVGLLTLGATLLPAYRHRVESIGLASRVVAYEAPAMDAAFDAASDGVVPAVLEVLAAAGARLQAAGAQAVVLAGAVLCGYGPALSARLHGPCFDGMVCAVRQAHVLRSLARPGDAF